MPRIKKKAFFYPSQDENVSSSSPTDQANNDLKKKQKQNNSLINLTEGIIEKKEGFATNNQVDEVHYHHETVAHLPYRDFTHLETPDQARTQYPFTHRLGNSSTKAQGIVKYENTEGVNVGPFNIYVQKE